MRAALLVLLTIGTSCAAGRREAWSGAESTPLPQRASEGAGEATVSEQVSRIQPRGAAGPVVLVTIDGARWQEIFGGTDTELSNHPRRSARDLVPHIASMAKERGAAVGAPGKGTMAATGPNFVSLPGYTELLTGRAPVNCQDNDCDPTRTRTLLDEVHAAGGKVAAFASWERLERAATVRTGRFVVSCGRHGDEAIEPWPGEGDFRPDRYTANVALEYLESERPDILFLGLGEPDEYAHKGDYDGYLSSLAYADSVVGRVFDTLERMGSRGAQTTVMVTADHGRARDFANHGGFAPESARVWFVAAGPSIAARGHVASASERHLADVAPTLRLLLGLSRDRSLLAGRPMDELFVSSL